MISAVPTLRHDRRRRPDPAPLAGRALAQLRAASSPANLLLVAILLVGWLALIGWTGAGPRGWQARLCAGLAAQSQSCGALPVSDATPGAATARGLGGLS
ncbi:MULTISPECIES: hypothetical protein [Methylobacterium]|uniref:hypothetical protein n=1 Tax=Methylobacterium TaxID=407 RepID=UPI001FE06CB1|nr:MULTISPECIES: hypothetical protein [Methylobacterium]MDR7036595.1 hypothetical protein [Methylobacterium sp. BE186]